MTAPCGSFCQAFGNCSLNFVNWGETLMMVDCLLNYTPDGKQPCSNPGYSVHKVNCRFSRCKFLCFWRC